MFRQRLSVLAVVGLVVAICGGGCGGKGNDVAPVSGRVTLNGQPLAGAQVLFTPTQPKSQSPYAGTQSAAVTDEDGRFKLLSFDAGPGAIVGTHRVEINKSLEGGDQKTAKLDPSMEMAAEDLTAETLGQMQKSLVPPKYNSQSTLSFEVPDEGTDQANFDLTSE